jgi:hypothetical protein
MAMMHGMAPVWTGILFRSEVFDLVGFVDKEALGPADLDFILRVASSYPYVLSKHPSAVFMLNADSFSALAPLSSFWPGWQRMFQNLEANEKLAQDAKHTALVALHEDARRMLLRRGANALARARVDFSREAAQILRDYYRKRGLPWALNALTVLCETMPGFQRLFTAAYRAWERRLVASRADLEARFGHLVRR